MKIDFAQVRIYRELPEIMEDESNRFFIVIRDIDRCQNVIDSRGNLMSCEWHYNILKEIGHELVDKKWHSYIIVDQEDGTKNVLWDNGKILFKDWVHSIEMSSFNGVAMLIAVRDGAYYFNFADMSGNYLLPEWVNGPEAVLNAKKYGFNVY